MKMNTENNFEKAYYLCGVAIEQCQMILNIIEDSIKLLLIMLDDADRRYNNATEKM